MKRRYVILFHDGVPEPHFDLLVESDEQGPLWTWRLPAWPLFEPADIQRLRDHRRFYLDYEGEIPGGRGITRRVDWGTCDVSIPRDGEFELQFADFILILRQLDHETWHAIRSDAR